MTDVNKVDLISGKQFREAGAAYLCHLADGKKHLRGKGYRNRPDKKIVTVLPEDTMGLTKLLRDYIVEANFSKIDDKTTQMEIAHYYSSSKWKVRLLNFYIKERLSEKHKIL